MEDLKISEATGDAMRDEKFNTYFDDLKDRFRELRKQHDKIIEKSLKIINEIGEVSSKIDPELKDIFQIKDVIRRFETVSIKEKEKRRPYIAMGKQVDVKKVLENYEKLNEIAILKESLSLFKRSKDTLGKIDSYLQRLSEKKSKHDLRQNSCVEMQIDQPIFTSCFSSSASLKAFKSIECCPKEANENCGSDIGYQGDDDESEIDLHASKKKL